MSIHFLDVPATFIHIPRTGGTSFKWWIMKNIQGWKADGFHDKVHHAQPVWNDLGLVFTFVRNPYDRMLSVFHFIGQQTTKRIEDRKLHNQIGKDWDSSPLTAHKRSREQEMFDLLVGDNRMLEIYEKGFDYWLELLYQDADEFYENGRNNSWPRGDKIPHRRNDPQVSWIKDAVNPLIIKTENLDTEFKKIQKLLKCNKPLGKVNTTTHLHYRDVYSNSSRKLIELMFKEDLDTFNYDF